MKKIQATPTKQDLGALLRVLFKIADEHTCSLYMEAPSGVGGSVAEPPFNVVDFSKIGRC